MAVRGNTPRKSKAWDAVPGFTQAMTATGTFALATISFVRPTTIIRMLGEYLISPTGGGTFAADDRATVTIGLGRVSSDAAALGASAMPDPAGETDYSWLYWAQHQFNYFAAGVGDSGLAGASVRVPFDVRSMRKFSPRESMVFVFEYTSINGAPPLTIDASATRCLLALD